MPDNTTIQCREDIYSNDYADFIIRFNALERWYAGDTADYCLQSVNAQYGIIHLPRDQAAPLTVTAYGYNSIPKLYTLLDSSNMDAAGITQVLDQPYLNLAGEGVLIGFIDTGIDYQNPLFRRTDGTSRIAAIWDQTIQGGRLPEDFSFGSEFLNIDINAALQADNPLNFVPSTDENGHGTFLAGIAAGNRDLANNFFGAAPEAEIAMVKLKPAKQYLRDYYLLQEDAIAYQDTDIMLGVRYLRELARRLGRPIVICIGLGSNSGDHTEHATLERLLSEVGSNVGYCIVTAAGNEVARSHHFMGMIQNQNGFQDVELRVGDAERGFCIELWSQPSELFSVGFISPTGEYIARLPSRINSHQKVSFVLENTRIEVDYGIIEGDAGSPLIFMRVIDPTPGIWRIRVFSSINTTGIFHMWLPITGFISSNTGFLTPNPEVTITSPAAALNAVTSAAYDHVSGGIYIYSSRGYTRDGNIVPDIAAPGVNVFGPGLNGTFTRRSGSSVAAAHVAGAAAILLNWGVVNGYDMNMASTNVRAYMIRGATRTPGQIYPNPEWGYGMLNLYSVFETLRTTV